LPDFTRQAARLFLPPRVSLPGPGIAAGRGRNVFAWSISGGDDFLSDIQTIMTSKLQNEVAFTIPALGGIPVAESVLVSWILMALIMAAVFLTTRKLKPDHPGRVQAAVEAAVGFLNRFSRENIGVHWRSFAPWLGTVAVYIACANLSGILGLVPPTKDLSVTAALALTSVFLIYGSSFRFLGLRGGLHKFAEPMPLLLPINVMEIAIRPLSLCMRLFGNVLGAFVIMELIKALVPVVVPVAFSLYFDIFDGIIQTIVFVFLTALFTGEALEGAT
jgi:F-type H+-transporting ATPase subunit a